jgi:hypothetical protein
MSEVELLEAVISVRFSRGYKHRPGQARIDQGLKRESESDRDHSATGIN